jgi:hypothetical protein
VAATLVAIFVGLSLMHVYWGGGGRSGRTAAVPGINGQPLFIPSLLATLAVAAALFAAAVIVAGTAGWLGHAVPAAVFRLLTLAISLVFLVRAIGDFKRVGFFQRAGDSVFAYWDLRFYSPLCLFIAGAALVLIWFDR